MTWKNYHIKISAAANPKLIIIRNIIKGKKKQSKHTTRCVFPLTTRICPINFYRLSKPVQNCIETYDSVNVNRKVRKNFTYKFLPLREIIETAADLRSK